MKKLITMLGAATLALLTSSCMEQHVTLSINKDGSGTITETSYFGDKMVANRFTMMHVNLGEVAKEEPEMIKLSPANSSFGVNVDSDLVLTFDSSTNGVTPESASANHATLGSNVAIHGSVAGAIGTGVLDVTNSGSGFAPGGDGAVTSNDFSWANQARTITFWWKAKVPVADIDGGTYVSFGTDEGPGTLFEINEGAPDTTSDLRVAVGTSAQTTASSAPADFDDGNWQFVAVTVPEQARLRDIAWYVNGSNTDLNTRISTRISTLASATGTGPLVFGDSVKGVSDKDLSPNGYIDDFQLYDGVLSQEQIAMEADFFPLKC